MIDTLCKTNATVPRSQSLVPAPWLQPLDHWNETQEEKLKDETKLYLLKWKQKNIPSNSLYVVYLCVETAVSYHHLNYIWYNLK